MQSGQCEAANLQFNTTMAQAPSKTQVDLFNACVRMLTQHYRAEVFLRFAKTFDQDLEVCRRKALAELIPGDFLRTSQARQLRQGHLFEDCFNGDSDQLKPS